MTELESARADAIRLLCAAQAEERLSVESFQDRLALVQGASSTAAIGAIVADLDAEDPLPVPYPDDLAPVAPAESLRVASILGSTRRDGLWTVPHHLHVKCILGEAVVDLRDAVFGSDLLDIDVDCILGTVRLVVPPGTQVENEVSEILGTTKHSRKGGRGYPASGLLVRIAGRVILGELYIKERPPRGTPEVEIPWWKRIFGSVGTVSD